MTGWVGVIDGGGTKTQGALVARDGTVRLLPPLEGSNPQDNPAWSNVLTAALAPMAEAELVLAGIGGFGEVPALDTAVRELLAGFGTVEPMNDVELALMAGFPDGGGVYLVCGTGSMAMAAGPAGIVRTGGWGHVVGDEGSAYWIGRAALSRASRELDGRVAAQSFATGLLAALDLDPAAPFALLRWLDTAPHERSAVAGLARLVDALATAGDDAAGTILDAAAGHLAELVTAAGARAGLDPRALWKGSGSTLQSRHLLAGLSARIGAPLEQNRTPLAAALALAADRARWSCDESWRAAMTRNLETQMMDPTQ